MPESMQELEGFIFNLQKKKKKEKRKRRKDQKVAMHLRSTLLSQVDGTSSDEDAQTFHSTGETCQ